MTIRLLVDYFGQPVGSLITRSAAEEEQMVSLKLASTDLTGGFAYVTPDPPAQLGPYSFLSDDSYLEFPATGNANTIYTDTTTSTRYVWDGAKYSPLSRFATDASGNVTGLVGVGLKPTGYDQTSEIQQYLNDASGSFLQADFASGDFIINGDLVIYSRKKEPLEGYGYNLRFRGAGPVATRFLDVRVNKTTPCILVTDPTLTTVGKRNNMAVFADFSLLSASTLGVPLSLNATPDGVGFMTKGSSGTGLGQHVLHQAKMSRVYFSGHQYPVSLDDTTQIKFDDVRWAKALTAVRLGGNCDVILFNHCAWGSEQSSSDASWMAMTCIENMWSSGITTPGNENIVVVDGAWVMRVGDFFKNKGSGTNIQIKNTYLEGVRRYYYADFATTVGCHIVFDNCHFSLMNENDFLSSDPVNANYGAKFQFGSTGINTASSNGPYPMMTLRDCYGSGPIRNAAISYNSRLGYINWENVTMPTSTDGFGHMRCIRDGFHTYRQVRLPPGNQPVAAKFSDIDGAGMGKISGDPIIKTGAPVAGTYNIHIMDGDRHEITLPDSDCTINMLAYSSTPPSNLVHRGAEAEIYLIAPGTVAANRTITFGSRLTMDATTLTMATTDAGKIAIFGLKAQSGSGNRMCQSTTFPKWVAIS